MSPTTDDPQLGAHPHSDHLDSQPSASHSLTPQLDHVRETPSAEPTTTTSTTQDQLPLSKRAQKRLLKAQKWEEGREARKVIRKEKKKQKQEERKKRIAEGLEVPMKKRIKLEDQKPSNMRVVVDCEFEDYMNIKEVQSTATQLSHCYSKNRFSPNPVQLSFTSLGPQLQKSMSEQHKEYRNWKVNLEEKSYLEVFGGSPEGKEEIVYLSADSENVINELDEGKVYVIGGIVDKNRHKGLCQDLATKAGIKTARLPISEFIHLSSRKVLTINHVFEILLKYLETKDWKDSFLSVIPARKGLSDKKPNEKNKQKKEKKEGDGEGEGQEVDEDGIQSTNEKEEAAEDDEESSDGSDADD
ncbi:tRNA (guanine(9)-N(1))-methyltransferase [Chytridiales sp. JEL 0842]|nr:tRNA (guanine(9)-N(1))-methyltransferase [Chytridiales sp. JEL 0842]